MQTSDTLSRKPRLEHGSRRRSPGVMDPSEACSPAHAPGCLPAPPTFPRGTPRAKRWPSQEKAEEVRSTTCAQHPSVSSQVSGRFSGDRAENSGGGGGVERPSTRAGRTGQEDGCREEPGAGAVHRQKGERSALRPVCSARTCTKLNWEAGLYSMKISASHTTIKLIAVGRKFTANDSKV